MKQNGYEAVVWTPHYNIPSFSQISADSIREHYEKYAPVLEEKTGLKIFMGSELYCTLPLPEQLVPLAGTDFVLVEFSYDTYPRYLDDVLYNIQLKGFRIIFAHVERYKWLFPEKKKLFKKTYDFSLVEKLKEKNIYFQVNQNTLNNLKDFKYMDYLFENDYVEFLGADKHRREDRRHLINFNNN
jgi:protein-tyrosine phosphatase